MTLNPKRFCRCTGVVRGRGRRQGPVYDMELELELELAVETDRRTVAHTIRLNGTDTPFDLSLDEPEPPRTLTLDPAYQVLPRLYPSEMPPSVNGLKGSESLVVVPETMGPDLVAAADLA